MRIAYLSLQPGGADAAATHRHALIKALGRQGIAFDSFCVSPALTSGLGNRAISSGLVQLHVAARLRRYDVLYVRMHPLAALAVLGARLLRRPVVVEVNGVAEDYFEVHRGLTKVKPVLRQLLRWQLRQASAVVAVTRGLSEWVETESGRRAEVVPNGADPQRFRPELPRPPDMPVRYVAFTGALSPWQGVMAAINAAQLANWPTDTPLVVIGDGMLREEVADAARTSGGRVSYLGPRQPDDVPPYVSNALATVALKQYHDEAAGQSPLKVYESLAAGVPVICTRLHGMYEVVAECQGGIVLDEATPESVARAVRRLAESETERVEMGKRARETIIARHTWDHRAAEIAAIIRRCIDDDR